MNDTEFLHSPDSEEDWEHFDSDLPDPVIDGTCAAEYDDPADGEEFVKHGTVLCGVCGYCEKYCHEDGMCRGGGYEPERGP